jgi:hypothetical protein
MTISAEIAAYNDPIVFARRIFGFDPHPAQQAVLRSHVRTRIVAAGRGFGKSVLASVDLAHFAVSHPGSKQLLVAPTTDQTRIIFDDAVTRLKASAIGGLIASVEYEPHPEIVLFSPQPGQQGVFSIISARPTWNDGKFLRGHHADRVVGDEAAYISDVVATTVIPQILATSKYGGRLLLSTPNGHNHFYELFCLGQRGQPGYESFQFPSTANPHINLESLEQQRRELPAYAYAVEYEAEFHEGQGSVFSRDLIESCIDDDAGHGEVRRGHRYIIGYDPARWRDRSAVVVLDITNRPCVVVDMFSLTGMDSPSQMSEITRIANAYNSARVHVDATSNDFIVEHLERSHIEVEGMKFTNDRKRQIIDGLRLVMERSNLAIPRNNDLIRELEYYRFTTTSAGKVRLGAAPGEFDDYVTALALAVALTYRATPQYVPPPTIEDYIPFGGFRSPAEQGWAQLRYFAARDAWDELDEQDDVEFHFDD